MASAAAFHFSSSITANTKFINKRKIKKTCIYRMSHVR
jgi:hypothetical protein